jgi:uncharacterized protein (TIGR04255 family)
MAEYRHLNNAPITEALIDIRVKPSAEGENVEQLDRLYEEVKNNYPDRKQQKRLALKVEFSPENILKETKKESFLGYRLTSADSLQIIQATPHMFAFSRMKPYETWEKLRDETQRIWNVYARMTKPEVITRVAARFINILELPQPISDFSDYLTSAPSIPSKLPQGLTSFFSRVVLPEPTAGAVAIITQTFEGVVDPKMVSIILDIDVFVEKSFESQDEAWATINKLREIKNLIFFESLTEKALKLYQ